MQYFGKHAVEKNMATTNDMGKTIEIFGFPAQVTADEVKEFIENHTGDGTVLTVRISKPNAEKARFTFATVRFTSKLGGEYVVAQAAAEKRLWFGSLYLKARKVEREIKTTAAARVHGELERMENVNVQWGNLVSKEEMKVIWKGEKWSVEYGIGVRKLGFYLSYEGVEYKMELCFENILGVQLRCSDDRGSKHFLIQVCLVTLLWTFPKGYQESILYL